MTKRFGFTLAEVLITLGIIGVVAAMSIPTLISNTNSAKFSAQYKKTLASLNQAVLMAQAQYDQSFATIDAATAAGDNPEAKMSLGGMMNGTLSGSTFYANVGDLKFSKNGTATAYALPTGTGKKSGLVAGLDGVYQLADGSLFVFKKAAPTGNGCTIQPGTTPANVVAALKTAGCYGYIDVNGPSLPNKEATCADGTASEDPAAACTVKKDAQHITDIYPVVFHDGTIEAGTNAAAAILHSAK